MKSRHFAQLVALSALWGASFLFIRIASPVMGPLVLAGCRVALAGATLALIMRGLQQKWPWEHWRELMVLGALSVAVPFLLYAWAALRLPAGYSALLNTTAVVFGTLASAWYKEDTLTVRKLLGCVCGFVGVGLIVRLGPMQPDAATLAAALACVTAAACYGFSTPLMKRATTRMQPLAIAAGIHVAAMVLVLPGALWALPQASFTAEAMGAVVLMGVVTSGLAYWAHVRIIRHVSPVAAMSPVFMIPVFGVTWGHLFLDEALSPGIFFGGALVLLASALVTGFNPLRRRPVVDPAP
ncbi:drug/metabolite transporter (DMT)-like permease [Hydrogenophaga palleronii]|uniref:Drug/metabolite transporter (DMT)-like permease n=1 Tax=Hydrogenophaga palleronii TaxID=65655 RepID=A0ABU1WGM8_9BURK|nr:DMT family transporter [Hydrogenophaga palleronii]MDR7148416.1 drug/metabolite transporter (DMT)-like permease [Hydrogenophaga palleronii]